MASTKSTRVCTSLNLYYTVIDDLADESGKQTADISVFALAWENGSLDIGYWTFPEVWFQKRLDRIRSHEAGPKLHPCGRTIPRLLRE